jgi:hypothetical protein
MHAIRSLLCIISLACASGHVNISTPREFPGFASFHGWNGEFALAAQIGEPLYKMSQKPADAKPHFGGCSPSAADYYNNPATGISKDLCAADPLCTYFNTGPCATKFGNFSAAVHKYSLFLAIHGENNTAPGAECAVATGGGNSPKSRWLYCYPMCDWWNVTQMLLNSYTNSTADRIHEACLKNSKCIGFRIDNTHQSSGDIFGAPCNGGRGSQTWIKLPTPTPAPTPPPPPTSKCDAACKIGHCSGGCCLDSIGHCWGSKDISANTCLQHHDWCWCG